MHEGEGENTGEIHLKRIVHNVQVVIDMEPEEAVSRVIVITCLTSPRSHIGSWADGEAGTKVVEGGSWESLGENVGEL
jgi:hypothetical protein